VRKSMRKYEKGWEWIKNIRSEKIMESMWQSWESIKNMKSYKTYMSKKKIYEW